MAIKEKDKVKISLFIPPIKFEQVQSICDHYGTNVEDMVCEFFDYVINNNRPLDSDDTPQLKSLSSPITTIEPIESIEPPTTLEVDKSSHSLRVKRKVSKTIKSMVENKMSELKGDDYTPIDQVCPKCGSHVSKKQHRQYTDKRSGNPISRYYCNSCSKTFSPQELHKGKEITEDELNLIRLLYVKGVSPRDISKELDRAYSTISRKIKEMRGTGQIPAIATITQLKQRLPKNVSYTTLVERMESYSDDDFKTWIKQIDDQGVAWTYNPDYVTDQFIADESDFLTSDIQEARLEKIEQHRLPSHIDDDAKPVDVEIDDRDVMTRQQDKKALGSTSKLIKQCE